MNSTKPRILQKGPLMPYLEQALADRYEVTILDPDADNSAFLASHGGEFVGLTSSARFGAEGALIDALPNLKVISGFGVGYEKIDVPRARERGIQVGYTPEVLNDCVADTAWGLLMDVARQFSASDRFLRRGEWLRGQYPLTRSIARKKLGILGMGRIGRVIAKRSSGFDMEVRYHNRREVPGSPYGYEPTLEGLARWADFLVVASAGGAETRKLVDAKVLEALGPEGCLINISRGSVIDEAALLDALQNQRIAGAGLDVFEKEPEVPEGFLALDNAVLLPHVASATHETRKAMADLVLENFQSYFASGNVKVAVP